MKTEIFSLFAVVSLFAVPTASAQLDEAFGDIEIEEPDTPPPPSTAPAGFVGFQTTPADATAESVMNDGGTNQGTVKIIPSWSDLSQQSGERINDTYEMRMREENSKPLPKRNPFGNRMDDLKSRLKPMPDRKF